MLAFSISLATKAYSYCAATALQKIAAQREPDKYKYIGPPDRKYSDLSEENSNLYAFEDYVSSTQMRSILNVALQARLIQVQLLKFPAIEPGADEIKYRIRSTKMHN